MKISFVFEIVNKVINYIDNVYFKFSLVMLVISSLGILPSFVNRYFNRQVSSVAHSPRGIHTLLDLVSSYLDKITLHLHTVLYSEPIREGYQMLREEHSIFTLYLLALCYLIFPRNIARYSLKSWFAINSRRKDPNWYSDQQYNAVKDSFTYYDFVLNMTSGRWLLYALITAIICSIYPVVRASLYWLPALWCVIIHYKRLWRGRFFDLLRTPFFVFELIYNLPSFAQIKHTMKLLSIVGIIWLLLCYFIVTFRTWQFFIKPIYRLVTVPTMPLKDIMTRLDPYSGQSEYALSKLPDSVQHLYKREEFEEEEEENTGEEEEDDVDNEPPVEIDGVEYETDYRKYLEESDLPKSKQRPQKKKIVVPPTMLTVSLPSINLDQLQSSEFCAGTVVYEQLDNGSEIYESVEFTLDDITHVIHDMLDTEFNRTAQYYITRATNRYCTTDPKYLAQLVMYAGMCASRITTGVHRFQPQPANL